MSVLPDSRNLIDYLLAEQQQLTAVDQFSRRHESGGIPAQARYYRALLPASPPGPGEQYAFAVDLDVCTGCKACVSACHSLNGLDDEETWRDIGLLVGGTAAAPYQQTITTACHHCVDPACANGCPVLAYEKDESTGIVRHLDDQCIGCQYCMLKCPYEVPKYSEARGIVRKCDMCHSRLAVGEAPACVQACPSGAIAIRVVSKDQIRELSTPDSQLLPGTFSSSYTKPTTSYSTRRESPLNAAPADAATFQQAHAHWPLIWMLLLTQLAAGLYVAIAVIASKIPAGNAISATLATTAFLILQAGLGVSVLHLGRPLGAWRAFLGLRKSWMSREIVAFGLFAGIAGLLSAITLTDFAALYFPAIKQLSLGRWTTLAAYGTAAIAILGVFCSVMIYVDTHRPFWAAQFTGIKFFGTMLLLGCAGVAPLLAWLDVFLSIEGIFAITTGFAIVATLLRTVLFGWEAITFHDGMAEESPIHRSSLIVWKQQRALVFVRIALFATATVLGIFAIYAKGKTGAVFGTAAFGLTFISQVIERYTFFTAVDAPRMPGGVAE